MKFRKFISVILAMSYMFTIASVFGTDTFLCTSNDHVSVETTIDGGCPQITFDVPLINTVISNESYDFCIDIFLIRLSNDSKYSYSLKKRTASKKPFTTYFSLLYPLPKKPMLIKTGLTASPFPNIYTLKMLRTTTLII